MQIASFSILSAVCQTNRQSIFGNFVHTCAASFTLGSLTHWWTQFRCKLKGFFFCLLYPCPLLWICHSMLSLNNKSTLAVLGNSPPLADQVSHWPCRLSPGRGITIRLDISAITIYDDKTTKKMTAAMTADCQKTWLADWHCQLEYFYVSGKSLRVREAIL